MMQVGISSNIFSISYSPTLIASFILSLWRIITFPFQLNLFIAVLLAFSSFLFNFLAQHSISNIHSFWYQTISTLIHPALCWTFSYKNWLLSCRSRIFCKRFEAKDMIHLQGLCSKAFFCCYQLFFVSLHLVWRRLIIILSLVFRFAF